MKRKIVRAHPYIPNSAPQAKAEMLRELGLDTTEQLFSAIPEGLRFRKRMNLPEPVLSEFSLKKHVNKILSKNKSTEEYLNFLGCGCYQHYVPAVCDEINGRNEFLTAYSGRAYEDHGRFQALFEYQSLMAELLDMEVVSLPTYDGDQAAATAMRMAANLTGRKQILVSKAIHPFKLSKILEYNGHFLNIKMVDWDANSGQIDLDQIRRLLSTDTAAIYFDNPNFFGVIEENGQTISRLAHQNGAISIVGADPISLGLLAPPSSYGADIVCGDIQSLGIHMQYGGGQAGYIATCDDKNLVAEYPNRITGLVPTSVPGEYGFGEIAFERTSFIEREGGKEWVGTMANLWAITAGVYLALMGPQGMREIGETILGRVEYAIQAFSNVLDLQVKFRTSLHFREFMVDFSNSGRSLRQVNRALLEQGIFGGYDIGRHFPEFKHHALFSITEVHSKEDIDILVQAVREVLA